MRFTRVLAKSTTVVVVAALTTLLGMTARAEEGDTTRISVSSTGVEANDDSSVHAVSENGRFMAFESWATNLTAGDTNGASDVFVHDRTTGETTRVSISGGGTQGNNDSFWPAISGDGRYVAFDSNATNLVPGDKNGVSDVFVHDRTTGETTRVSIGSDGTEGDDASSRPSISLDGRFITYHSNASNLVSGDTNGVSDVFVHNRATGSTNRVSISSNGAEADGASHDASISADGSQIVFVSWAGNLAPGDTNDVRDIFHHDRTTGETTRISVHSNGNQGNDQSSFPHISPEGDFVAFESDATNLVPGDTNETPDAFIHDLAGRETSRVSVASNGQQGNGRSVLARISHDARYIAFTSEATNLVPGDTNGVIDAFVHDRTTGVTSRVSVNSNGGEDNGLSGSYSISPTGRYVGLISDATNLVPGDTNGVFDVFVHQYLPHVNYFTDDDGHLFEDDINTIAWAGITRGCNPPDNDHYCPDESFLRGQAAAFLRRALEVPASNTEHFTDDNNSVFEEDINAIAEAGITRGCNPPDNTLFCPDDPFTRGQAAAFVRRALNVPASSTDHFVDDNDSVFEGDINAIAEAAITRGCNPPDNDRYCPDELLTRGQAAAFMRRALLP